MKTLLLFVAFAMSAQGAFAADIYLQEQNELWMAQQAAQNILLDGDCAKTTITRNTKYKLYNRNGNIFISAASYTISCTLKKPVVTVPPPNSVSLSWDAPTTRENGTPLSSDEIAGYYLYHNDTQIRLGKVNSLVIPDLPPGRHEFYIQTIDTGGVVSKNSAKVAKSL